MWSQALGPNEGLQTIAVFTANVVGLALLVIAVVAHIHVYGRPPLIARVFRLARHVRSAARPRFQRLRLAGQKAFLRYADRMAGILTNLAEAIDRAAERADATTRHRDPRLG